MKMRTHHKTLFAALYQVLLYLMLTLLLVNASEEKLPDSLANLKRALDHAQDARTVVKNEYFRLLAESLAPAEQFWLRKRDANYLEKSASMQKLTEICHRQRVVDVNDAPFLAKHIICFDSGGVIDNFYEKPSVSSILKTLGRQGSQACLQEIKTMKFQNPDPPTLVKLTYLVRFIKSDTQEFVNQSVLELGADHYAVKNGYLSVKS